MYRRTRKTEEARARQLAAMQRGRDLARMEGPAPDYPAELPELRMRITVERFDLAQPEHHVFELRTTRRVDQYAVSVDGKPWRVAGLSVVLEGLRFHDLRHSTASALLAAAVDLYTVGGILGHKSTQSTKRYAHLSGGAMAKAIGAL